MNFTEEKDDGEKRKRTDWIGIEESLQIENHFRERLSRVRMYEESINCRCYESKGGLIMNSFIFFIFIVFDVMFICNIN